MNWNVDEVSRNVHIINFSGHYRSKDWEQWILNISDVHFDSTYCDRQLLYKHLDEAVERNAPVIVNGDTFDAMQGKFDPRRSYIDMRPEYVGSHVRPYYDSIVHDSVKKLSKYAEVLTVFGYGNHETAVDKNANTDILRSFVDQMKAKGAKNIYTGGYGGWIFLRFESEKQERTTNTLRLKYFHGSGGGAPVTLGTIQGQRMFARYPQADILTTGHIHNKWAVTRTHEKISKQGRIYLANQLQLCTGGYKEEYDDGSGGWHVERGADPKPLGGYWIRITCGHSSKSTILNAQAMEAI